MALFADCGGQSGRAKCEFAKCGLAKCGLDLIGGSYLRRIDSCITQLKAQGPWKTCNESTEGEEEGQHHIGGDAMREPQGYLAHQKHPHAEAMRP